MRFCLMVLVLLVGGLTSASASTFLVPKDSLRTETVQGIRYIIHQVESGETLFALTRRYGVSQGEIIKANTGLTSDLKVGQLVRIPTVDKVVSGLVHTVAPGETLFSLSQKYGVSVSDIKAWNNLTSNDLIIGQELMMEDVNEDVELAVTEGDNPSEASDVAVDAQTHTVEASQTLFAISKLYGVTVADLRIWNKLPDNNIRLGQELFVSHPTEEQEMAVVASPAPTEQDPVLASDPVDEQQDAGGAVATTSGNNTNSGTTMPTRISESVLDLGDDAESTGFANKVIEKGLCEVINGSGESKKYLAMHPTAPIGTVMLVRNEMNDLNVFVRVVAKLPGVDATNDKLILKISQAAYERLGAMDRRFPIEVSYIP